MDESTSGQPVVKRTTMAGTKLIQFLDRPGTWHTEDRRFSFTRKGAEVLVRDHRLNRVVGSQDGTTTFRTLQLAVEAVQQKLGAESQVTVTLDRNGLAALVEFAEGLGYIPESAFDALVALREAVKNP